MMQMQFPWNAAPTLCPDFHWQSAVLGGAQFVQRNFLLSPNIGFSRAWMNHDTYAFPHLHPHSQMRGNQYQNDVLAPEILSVQKVGSIWEPQGSPCIASPRLQDWSAAHYNQFHEFIKTRMQFAWKPEYLQVLHEIGIVSWMEVFRADLQDARLARLPALQVALKKVASEFELQYTKLPMRSLTMPGIQSDLMDMLRHHMPGSCRELYLSSLVNLGILSCSDAVRAAANGDFAPFSKSGVPQRMRRQLDKLAASFSATGILCLTRGLLKSANLPRANEQGNVFKMQQDAVRVHSTWTIEGLNQAPDVLSVFYELIGSVKQHMTHPWTDEDSQELWDMGIVSPVDLSFIFEHGFLDTFLILRSPLQAALKQVAKDTQDITAPVLIPCMDLALIDLLETHMQQTLCRFMRSSLANLGILTCADAAVAVSEGKCGDLSLSGIPMDLRRPLCHVAALENSRRTLQTASTIDNSRVDWVQGVNLKALVGTGRMADEFVDPMPHLSRDMGVSSNRTDVTETHLHLPHTIATDSRTSQHTAVFRRAGAVASMSGGTSKIQRRQESMTYPSTRRSTRHTIYVPESSVEHQYDGQAQKNTRQRKISKDSLLTLPSVILKKSNIPNSGLGLFAVHDIEANKLISEYGGEVISVAEGARRRIKGDGTHVRSMGMHSVGKSSWLLDASVTDDFPTEYYVKHHMMGGFVNGSKIGSENAVYFTSNVVCLGYTHPYSPREAGVGGHKRKRTELTDPLCHPYRTYIKSSKLIKAGEEILTNYGTTYWNFHDELQGQGGKPHFEE